jgi:hypothetical protein
MGFPPMKGGNPPEREKEFIEKEQVQRPVFLSAYAEAHACVPCLRRSGFAQAGETPAQDVLAKAGTSACRHGFCRG